MFAEYSPTPFASNNPLIEALPPMLAGKELIHALACVPPYRESDRELSAGKRLQLLSFLYDFYQPLPMTLDLYCEVYNALQHCYGQYTSAKEASALQLGYAAMQGKALAASVGGGNSFSVIGVSGLGKSTALQRVLSLFPQIIEHRHYHGKQFFCHQVLYLVVQTPHDASIKALILDIYLQLDSLLGTSYQRDALSKRLSVDVLVSQLNQIVRINHIGLLVIDELQNIAYRKGDGGIRFLNFLVHLINGTGVSVCMVGTPRVLQVLQQEFRSARRTTGLIYDRLENNTEFSLLLRGLWHYQYTRQNTALTPELQNWLEMPEFYYHPQGLRFLNYEINESVAIAKIEYQYNENDILVFLIDCQDDDTASKINSSHGKNIKTLETISDGIKVSIEESKNDGDEESNLTAQWKRENVSYYLSGKIKLDEMIKMVEKMKF